MADQEYRRTQGMPTLAFESNLTPTKIADRLGISEAARTGVIDNVDELSRGYKRALTLTCKAVANQSGGTPEEIREKIARRVKGIVSNRKRHAVKNAS